MSVHLLTAAVQADVPDVMAAVDKIYNDKKSDFRQKIAFFPYITSLLPLLIESVYPNIGFDLLQDVRCVARHDQHFV